MTVIPGTVETELELLDLAASLERGSEHPLGAAILAAGREQELGFRVVASFGALAGHGVEGLVGATPDAAEATRSVLVGNPPAHDASGGSTSPRSARPSNRLPPPARPR